MQIPEDFEEVDLTGNVSIPIDESDHADQLMVNAIKASKEYGYTKIWLRRHAKPGYVAGYEILFPEPPQPK